jgi:hypothetical protein
LENRLQQFDIEIGPLKQPVFLAANFHQGGIFGRDDKAPKA